MVDLLRAAAPKPFVVIEVGKARRSLGARSVALHAVDFERRRTGGDGELAKFVVGQDRADVLLGNRIEELLLRGGCGVQLRPDLAAAGIAEHAGGGGAHQRPGGIEDHIDHPPHDGRVERPQPPAGHRIVEFPDAVPFVAGRGDAADLVDVLFAHDQSSTKGILEASSALVLLPGRKAKSTAPMKKSGHGEQAPTVGEGAHGVVVQGPSPQR